MNSSSGSVKSALDRAEAAGISIVPASSRFSEKLFSFIDVVPENTASVRQLVSALERTLNRSHDDARLVLSLCLSLQEFSGLLMPDLLKKIEKAIKFLDKPASATVVRTIKNSTAAALHPKVIDLHDLDAITALGKAPQHAISTVEGKAEVLRVGSEEINLVTSNKREIEAAVRKVKAEAKKSSDPARKNSTATQETAPPEKDGLEQDVSPNETPVPLQDADATDDEELEFTEELHTELDEAALALSKLLRSMPRRGKLSNLAQVIEQARKLLESTRQNLSFTRSQDETGSPIYGDLN